MPAKPRIIIAHVKGWDTAPFPLSCIIHFRPVRHIISRRNTGAFLNQRLGP